MHDLLIAKVAAYGFDYNSLVFVPSYLSERQERNKVTDVCNTFSDILCCVPQGSILVLLLFNIYISDIFYDIGQCNIASYADDNTPYTSDKIKLQVLQ